VIAASGTSGATGTSGTSGATGGMTLVSTLNPVAQSSYLCSWTLSPGVRYQIKLNLVQNTSDGILQLRFNADSGNNYNYASLTAYSGGPGESYGAAASQINIDGQYLTKATYYNSWNIDFWTQTGSNSLVIVSGYGTFVQNTISLIATGTIAGSYSGAANLSSITILTSAGTFSGNVSLYTFN
jgi:hypothetical protein